MKRFRVIARVSLDFVEEIDAETPEEAVEKVEAMRVEDLNYACDKQYTIDDVLEVDENGEEVTE